MNQRIHSGCKMYDILAGKQNMESSYVLGAGKALEAFPMLKKDGLCGAVVYYDGEFQLFLNCFCPIDFSLHFDIRVTNIPRSLQVNTTTLE